MKPKLELDMLV